MNKRKLMLVAVALCMVAILGFGGTLAYLTDTDNATNVFTVGNVKIELLEEFNAENAKLLPNIPVTKKVTVKNTGSEEAYVRVHIAIPALLDSGDEDNPQFAAYNNRLHFNYSDASVADGQWNWTEALGAEGATGEPGKAGSKWQCYDAKVDGINYNVYVVTYETKLASQGVTATEAMYQVYLDASLDNVHIQEITDTIGAIKILVAAEAVQAEGFEDAYEAFDAAYTDANENDKWDIVNLPENLIEHLYGTKVEGNVSSTQTATTNSGETDSDNPDAE